jgi:PAS domain S-box-containing protein
MREFIVPEDVDDPALTAEKSTRSELVYRALAEASASVLWRADPSGAATDIRGWSNLEGRTGNDWIEAVHGDDRQRLSCEIRAMVRAASPTELRFRVQTPTGEYRRCLARAVPIKDDRGRVLEWVGTLTDVEDQLVAQEALHRADRLKSVGRLTAGLAHDFNNLLTVITGGAEALVQGLSPDDKLHEQAKLTLHAAERGAELVRDLLAFSRQQPLQPRAVAIDGLLSSIEPLIRRLLGEDVRFEVQRPPTALACMADPARLETALMNLCINARDAMPEGGLLSLEAELVVFSEEAAHHSGLTPGAYVVFTVSDNGCGMAPEVLERAVEPFFTTKPAGLGSGLGLSMVYGFTKQSAGHMALSSSPDAGTRVRLYLPQAEVPPAVGPVEPGPATLLAGIEVLLVEDDPLVRSQVARHLAGLGCEAIAVATAGAALERLAAGEACDLLMTDIVLPGGIDGFELARRARALRPSMPVLFTSGYSEDRVTAKADLGIQCFLQKPYRRAALARAISDALGKDQGGS